MRILIALVLSMLIAGRAEAHALLRHSTPSAGAVLNEGPKQLDLYFSEGLEPAFSSVTVTDAQGTRVDTAHLNLAPGDDAHAVIPLKPSGPGSYHVEWHATSVDTHRTQGSFDFSVGPAGTLSTTPDQDGSMGAMPGMKM